MKTGTPAPLSSAFEDRPSLPTLIEQRNLALAGLIFSITLSMVVLWSNFGLVPNEIGETQAAVEMHKAILHQNQIILAENQRVLAEVEASRNALLKGRDGR